MKKGKIRRDLLIAFASQLAFKVLGFVVLAVMARLLSQAEYGKLMFALTLCGVTVLATDLGASTDLSRRVAAAPAGARRRLEAVLSARLPLVAAYLVLLPAWVAVTKPDALAVAAAIAVFSVCKDLYRTYSSLFQGLHRIGYTVAAFGASLVVLVIAVAAGVLTGGGLAWMTGAHVLSGAVLLGVAAGITRLRIGPIRLRSGWRRMQRVFKESVWLFVLSVAGLVHFGADTVMLGYLQPYEQVARYQAAAKLLEASQFVVRPLTLILLPVCAALASRQQWGDLRRLMHKMFAGMAVLGVAAWGFVALLALPIIRIVYTATYDRFGRGAAGAVPERAGPVRRDGGDAAGVVHDAREARGGHHGPRRRPQRGAQPGGDPAVRRAGGGLGHGRLPDLRRRVADRRRLPERGPASADGRGTGAAARDRDRAPR